MKLSAFAALVVFIFSFLPFSEWYVVDDWSLRLSILFIFFLCLIFSRLPFINYPSNGIPLNIDKVINIFLLLAWFLAGISFLSAEIPFLVLLQGVVDYKDVEFPPLISVICQSVALFGACLSSLNLLNSASPKKILYLLLFLLIFVAFVGRGIFAVWALFSISIYINLRLRINLAGLKRILRLSVLGIIFIATFGFIGEFRSNNNVNFNRAGELNESVIRYLAEPTSEFDATGLPDSFLWLYVYGISPLANLQSLDKRLNTGNIGDFSISFVPDFMTRILGIDRVKDKNHLVNDFFNTSTGFAPGVSAFGIFGIFLTTIIMLSLIYFSIIILNASVYREVYVALCSALFANMWFANLFVKDIYFFTLVIAFIMAYIGERIVVFKKTK